MIQTTLQMLFMSTEPTSKQMNIMPPCYRSLIHPNVTQSSDITRDRDTRQVKISLDGKKHMDTGGLPSHLTIAENAYVRLTSNIDVTDRLANGVRGIIQKIIINEDGAVNTILVKFDNEGI